MNLAIKLYSSDANPRNVPGTWPSQVVELGESTTLPDNTWLLMTVQEFENYKAIHKAEYDAWYLTYLASLPSHIVPPQTVVVQSQPEPMPFAQPTYRTKMDATLDLLTVQPNTIGDLDFKLLAERYVTGGELIVENAEFGDYITAAVEDIDGVIPALYRPALCEAWPIVATYIVKSWICVETPGTLQAGSVSCKTVDTYPLNAKISAGLHLCIEYHATATGLPRRVAMNYHLTKKL